MAGGAVPVEGECRCGQVRMRITKPPLITMVCHCRGCQRMTSSAFSLSVGVRADGFEVTAGEPAIGGLHAATRHYFCPHCKSWMFTRPEGADNFVNVRATLLDDPACTTPFMETYASAKLPWVTTPAIHSFPEFPAYEDFARLIAAYAAAQAAEA